MTRICSLALAVVLLSPTAANALLIEGLCDGTADSTVTCDTDTGLEWLDLTETLRLSANQFLADTGGWVTAGWSMATGGQVDSVLSVAGFTNLTGQSLESQVPAAHLMLDLFGRTFENATGSWGVGYAVHTDTLVSVPQYLLLADGNHGAVFGGATCCNSYDAASVNAGIWANRVGAISVPEPGTLALLGLALAGLGLTRRNRA